jgi:hypothetical protein
MISGISQDRVPRRHLATVKLAPPFSCLSWFSSSPLLIAVLLIERLVIRLSPDSMSPDTKMLSSWCQAWSLVILALNATHIVALNITSIVSDIESTAESLGSSFEGEVSQLVGDLEKGFEDFEQDVESELSKALVNHDGVLAQFALGHQTYAMRLIAPALGTSLMANTGYHRSALN